MDLLLLQVRYLRGVHSGEKFDRDSLSETRELLRGCEIFIFIYRATQQLLGCKVEYIALLSLGVIKEESKVKVSRSRTE